MGFSRLIPSQCLACHSESPNAMSAQTAMGCENCHGPGGQQVDHPGKETIVNPARIDRRLADDICMNCHQAGDTRVFELGKTFADFRPGTPLSDTVAIFKISPDPGARRNRCCSNTTSR